MTDEQENENAEAQGEDEAESNEQEAPEQAPAQPQEVTEDELVLGATKIGVVGEHITLKMDASHPLAAKLIGRTISLPVHFEAE